MTTIIRVAALAAALLLAAAVPADQTDARLGSLFEAIRSAPDAGEANEAAQMIWSIWRESGREDVDRLMLRGILAMESGEISAAIAAFDRIVELAPGFAEGWNKRATAHFLGGNLPASVLDIERTLALEPRHFGAISGMGLIFLRRGDDIGALNAFERVLDIHPHAPGARFHVERLRRKLQGKQA